MFDRIKPMIDDIIQLNCSEVSSKAFDIDEISSNLLISIGMIKTFVISKENY